MAIKPYLQLVRLPNLFTAVADSYAGWLIVGGAISDVAGWGPLVLASLCIYAGGVVLNDVFDYRIDQDERPGRPLPSGRVNYRFAVGLGVGLMAAGVASAALSSTRHGAALGVALASCVLAYDAGLKRTVVGPQVMGACRGLNLLLGMSFWSSAGGPAGWLAALSYGTFVAGITWVSRSEVRPDKTRNPGMILGMNLEVLALIGLATVCLLPGIGFTPTVPDVWSQKIGGLAVVAGVLLFVGRKFTAALRAPSDATVQAAVKAGIFSLVWINVALVMSTRGPVAALSVAWLAIPAVLAGRWVYST